MRIPLIVALQIAAAAGPQPRPQSLREYRVDAGESAVEWSVPFTVVHVKGRFPQVLGTILYDPYAPTKSSVSIVIVANSISSGWEHRDEHLRTEDFFDVDRYPTITFQSERLDRSGDDWIAIGPFTMHGVTRRISIPFRFVRPPTRSSLSGWMVMDVVGGLRINRRDFGVNGGDKHNSWFNAARQAAVGDSVDISIQLEGYSADAGAPRSPGISDWLKRIAENGTAATLDLIRQRRGDRTDAQWAPYYHGADLTLRALVADNRVTEAAALSRGLASELFPTNVRAWLVNGFVLDAAGDRRGAATSYERARALFRPRVVDPNERFPQVDENWYWIDQLVLNALEWGRAREAAGLARVSASLYGSAQGDPAVDGRAAYGRTSFASAARAQVTLGIALLAIGDTAGARAAFALAREIDPSETRAMEWQRRSRP